MKTNKKVMRTAEEKAKIIAEYRGPNWIDVFPE